MNESSYVECEDDYEEEEVAEVDFRKEGYRNDQLYCAHLMLKQAWNGNFGAPVNDLLSSNSDAKVLDFGCGSGYWTLEMATEYPSPKFYGINPVASFPGSVLPRNVEFIVSNVLTDTLPFKDAEFDYVFARNIMFTFHKPNFESIVMKEILRVLKPGGYIEFVEEEIIEGHNRGKALMHWNIDGLKVWLESQKIDYEIICRFKECLQSTNQLKDITEQKLKIPIGKSNGFIGELAAEYIMCTVKSMADNLMPIMNLTNEEYDHLVEEIEKEVKENEEEYNAYFHFRRYFAIKM
ncbi:hypothetical protein RclHR1_00040005 [Rhizophagus clarus]|uniref:Methyltransferase domain-containing protein n=1 Tax=Rhizophagus clarus TaxID=94130 RepID=A0A2Z6RFI9_9GLOM|nr:hypothetical protein RclHR1_00040005 [Rhizophagus clarus]